MSSREPRRRQRPPGRLHALPVPAAVALDLPAEVLARHPQHCALVGRGPHRGRRPGIGADGRPARPEDAGLLPPHRLSVRPQPVEVVEGDLPQQGAVGVHHVDGVQPAAQADLQQHQVQRLPGEAAEGGQGAEFEIGQRDIATGGLDLPEGLDQRLVGHGPAVDADALVVALDMGGGVGADPQARGPRHGLEQRHQGTLAIGAAHGDQDAGQRPRPQAFMDRPRPPETEFDPGGIQPFQPGQPVCERLHARSRGVIGSQAAGRRVRMASRRAMRSRISRRSTIMSMAPCSSRNSLR